MKYSTDKVPLHSPVHSSTGSLLHSSTDFILALVTKIVSSTYMECKLDTRSSGFDIPTTDCHVIATFSMKLWLSIIARMKNSEVFVALMCAMVKVSGHQVLYMKCAPEAILARVSV